MGLLNRKTVAAPSQTGASSVLAALKPPYYLNDFLMVILQQLSEWIPGEGYYAYVAGSDSSDLLLKATRAASGIATVGPNYAGLVLGGGIRTVPLDMSPPGDAWAFAMGSDGLLTLGFGPKAAFRVAVDPKWHSNDAFRGRIQQWLREQVPLLDLLLLVESRPAASSDHRVIPEVQRSRQDLLLQIPHLMGLLAGLGTGVLKSADGYLAIWRDRDSVQYPFVLGLGRELGTRVSPQDLYATARSYQVATWEGSQLPESVATMGFRSLVAIPLDGAEGSAGILCLATAEVFDRSHALVETLRQLRTSLKNTLDSRGASYAMAQNYLQALLMATRLLDQADPYNQNHHQEVARLSARLAMKAGWPENRVRVMELAGRLHDLGMVAVSLDVTRERGNLAEQARKVIQQHSMVGAALLSGLPDEVLPSIVGRAVREHHERYDGLGYPDGLTGDEVSPEGGILACAEQFVARISQRSYRQGLSAERALYELEKLSGNFLSPEVVSLLMAVYAEAGIRPQAPV